MLLFSLGINVGLLASRWAPPQATLRDAVAARAVSEASSAPVEGEGRVASPRGRIPAALQRLVRELGLQGQEKDAFLALQQHFLHRLFEGRREIHALQQEMRHQLIAKTPDRDQIDQTLKQLSEAYVDLESAFVDALLSSRELLEPRQEKIYLRFMQKVRQVRTGEAQRLLRHRRDRFRARRGQGGS